jgi:hypothetical protein
MDKQKISCPECGHQFAIEEVLEKQLLKKLESRFESERNAVRQEFLKKQQDLKAREQALEEKKKKENELFLQRMEKEKASLRQQMEAEVRKSMDAKLKFYSEEAEKSQAELKKMREQELALLREKQELQRMKDEMEVKVQKELLEARQAIEAKAIKEAEEKNRLREEEYKKQLADVKKQLQETQRKAEQGSMQLQGEVLELVLEEELKKHFPFDLITEVPKGVRGADVIQTVRNAINQDCGQIIYESKRTKTFSADWIEKLKSDQRQLGADVAVLVTEAMPREMTRFGQMKGVWICPFEDVHGIALMLRESIIQISSAKEAQENKGDKMELLYNFLTGTEFKGNLQAIVEGFNTMQDDLIREKRAMEKIWKTREKQIEKVVKNTIHMYGSIRGIAGNAIGKIQSLELPSEEDEELTEN